MTQHYIDLLDDTGQIDITAWHCTMCGEVLDPVILKNRRSQPPNLLYGTKQRKFSQRVMAASDSRSVKQSSDDRAPDESDEGSVDQADEDGAT